MLGVYFSGTGNTKYCTEKFLEYYEKEANLISIEDKEVKSKIQEHTHIVFAYPIYYSNLPKIVKDFVIENQSLFFEKNIFIITTMGLFSGDGNGCCARILKKYGANIIGGIQVQMPDCIGDVKLLKKTLNKNKQIVIKANEKIKNAVKQLKKGSPPKEGLGVSHHVAGFFGQRLWFLHMTKEYSTKIKIAKAKCIGCGTCVTLCPMKNLKIVDKIATSQDHCTMCYRCINHCPKQAITLIGETVVEQCRIENYL